tara:strand:+ start:105 stop:359 length:255 start_codon:yes stop_codon:yes gene_type:complete
MRIRKKCKNALARTKIQKINPGTVARQKTFMITSGQNPTGLLLQFPTALHPCIFLVAVKYLPSMSKKNRDCSASIQSGPSPQVA